MNSMNLSRRSFLSGAAAVGALGAISLAGCAPKGKRDGEKLSDTGSEPKEVVETLDTDVVIVGLGGAGLACAVQAGTDNLDCIVLEKNPQSGGNAIGVEGMFAINSSMQKAAGIREIKPVEVVSKQMEMLQYRPNGSEWITFCENSADNLEWCLEQGVEYKGVVDTYDPNGVLETFHWFKNGSGGEGYVPQMTKRVEELGMDVRYNTRAQELVLDESGAISGIYAEGPDGLILINAKAVILATGGFCGNEDIIKRQGWDTEHMVISAPDGTGDGYLMATAIGAEDDLVNSCGACMPIIPCFPLPDYMNDPENPISGMTGFATGAQPGMWVNENGDRFVREDGASVQGFASAAIATRRNAANFCVFDQNIYDTYLGISPETKAMFEEAFEADDGTYLYSSDSLDDLANHFDIDAEGLKASVERYNNSCQEGEDQDFLKDPSLLVPVEKAPYYIARMGYVFYFAIGGLKIDKYQRVWDTNRKPIPGLYAAGNDGNNHYSTIYTVKIPGTAFGNQVNSGRVAAREAAKYIAS